MYRMRRLLGAVLVMAVCLTVLPVGAAALEVDLSVLENAVAAVEAEAGYEAEVLGAASVAVSADNFPDAAFCAYVTENCDTNGDGTLTPEELAAVTVIDCTGMEIASLVGLEYFPALEELYCGENDLTKLDLSKNPALTVLLCGQNRLTSLDVTMLGKLRILDCGRNALTALDVSKNHALRVLTCDEMGLTALDVSGSPDLNTLYCNDNAFTELDLTANHLLRCAVQGEGNDVMYVTAWDYTREVESVQIIAKIVVDKTVSIVCPAAGDTNGDGVTDAGDLASAMKAALGEGDASALAAADMNFDGAVDILDVIRLVRQLAEA